MASIISVWMSGDIGSFAIVSASASLSATIASTVAMSRLASASERLLPKLQCRDGDVLGGLLGFVGLYRVGEELRQLLVQGALLGLVDLQQALAELNERLVGCSRPAGGALSNPANNPAIPPFRPAPGSGQDADEIEHRVSHLRAGEDLAACLRLIVGRAFGGGGVGLAPVDLPRSTWLPPPCPAPDRIAFRPVVATIARSSCALSTMSRIRRSRRSLSVSEATMSALDACWRVRAWSVSSISSAARSDISTNRRSFCSVEAVSLRSWAV